MTGGPGAGKTTTLDAAMRHARLQRQPRWDPAPRLRPQWRRQCLAMPKIQLPIPARSGSPLVKSRNRVSFFLLLRPTAKQSFCSPGIKMRKRLWRVLILMFILSVTGSSAGSSPVPNSTTAAGTRSIPSPPTRRRTMMIRTSTQPAPTAIASSPTRPSSASAPPPAKVAVRGAKTRRHQKKPSA